MEAGASIADLQTWLGDSTQSAALGYVHAKKSSNNIANSMTVLLPDSDDRIENRNKD
jgi:hypothetical protein